MRKLFLIALVLILGLGILTLVAGEQTTAPGFDDIPQLDALVAAGFSDAVATRTTKAGENLQRLANVAYGTQLAWPLVWWANRDTIPDPERFSKGITVKVPRLVAGFEDSTSALALDAAYVLVYRRYKTLPARKADERRWVLLQAASSGVDFRSELWSGILDPADKAWAEGKLKIASKPGVVQESPAASVEKSSDPAKVASPSPSATIPSPLAALASPEPEAKAVLVFSKSATRKEFLGDIVAGTPIPQEEMEAWTVAVAKSGEADAVIAALELEAAKPDAPPQVHLALALSYKRKGLVQKEYAALVRTEEAAVRRPEVVFNVLLLSGRKKLIESAVPASEIMVGEVQIVSEPSGATVNLDGLAVGTTPLTLPKVAIGDHKLILELAKHQIKELDLSVALAKKIKLEEVLDRKTGILRVKSNARNQLFISEQYGHFDYENEVPFGTHTLVIKDANFETYEEIIDIEPDQVVEKNITLKEVPASWKFYSGTLEGATVELDGEVIGRTPLEGFTTLPGSKELTLRYLGRPSIHRLVDFDANQEYYLANGIHSSFIEPPFVIPTKTIKIDGKIDDWEDVDWVENPKYQEEIFMSEPGNFIDQFKMAQDDRYVYWYIHVSDGPISTKPVFNYAIKIPNESPYDPFHTAMIIKPNFENTTMEQLILSNVGKSKNDFIDLLNNQGSNSNFKILGDIIECRFSKNALSPVIKKTVPFFLDVSAYKEGKTLVYGDFKLSNLTFQPLESFTPELSLLPSESTTVALRANQIDPTLVGKVTMDKNQKNKDKSAMKLDGASFVELPKTHLLPGSSTFTMSGWVNIEKHNPTNHNTILALREGKDLWQFAILGKKPAFTFWTDQGDEYKIRGTSDLSEKNWYHLAARFDGKTVQLFVNGKLEKSTIQKNGSDPITSLEGITIAKGKAVPMIGAWSRGSGTGEGNLNGRIGAMEVYYEALSDKKIGELYTSSR